MSDNSEDLLGAFAHISDIVNNAISGVIAFFLYWPFIWLFFNLNYLEDHNILDIFIASYNIFPDISSSWLNFPFIVSLPILGFLNQAILCTFIDTVLIKWIFGNCPLSKTIYKSSVNMLEKQLNILNKDKILNYKIDDYFNPCMQLLCNSDFVGFRYWLNKNPIRKKYWDWEHFMDWVYKTYYQTLIVFLILYSILLILEFYKFDSSLSVNYQAILLFFVAVLLTYALYIEYLKHHIAWVFLNITFYMEYLSENRDISCIDKLKKCLKNGKYYKSDIDKLKEYLKNGNYKDLSEELKSLK